MRKIFVVTLVTMTFLLLAACTKIVPYYKPDIQQGNIITQTQVNQLKRGMTQEQVIAILGDPVLKPAFYSNELVYINTNKPGHGATTEQRLILYFKNKRLAFTAGDFRTPF